MAARTPQNLTPSIAAKLAAAVAIVTERRTALALQGYECAGRFTTHTHNGEALALAGAFIAPGWKVLARVSLDGDRLESAPGYRVKTGTLGLSVTAKPTKTRPKVLAENLRDMTAAELADALEALAPRPFKIMDVRAFPADAGAMP